jgi:hypothetical protein
MNPKEYEAKVKDLEIKLDRLRSLYDQYFRGFEKMPPLILKKEVENRIRTLTKVRMKNTALRFRLQVQIQKYSTFLAYWQRMMRELEEGKIKRAKGEEIRAAPVKGYAGSGRSQSRSEESLDIDIDIDLDDSNA